MSSANAQLSRFVGSSKSRTEILEDLFRSGKPKTPTELATQQNKHVSHVCRALKELRREGLVAHIEDSSKSTYYDAGGIGFLTSTPTSPRNSYYTITDIGRLIIAAKLVQVPK